MHRILADFCVWCLIRHSCVIAMVDELAQVVNMECTSVMQVIKVVDFWPSLGCLHLLLRLTSCMYMQISVGNMKHVQFMLS